MPTPAIQTLINDAQQVLNLDSISAVRSVVAVSLANANTGTPLNPNLTTQQLWNEFYQVVTRSKSDIESIIANQLMKFLFSPPAPGGAGADKQVIFNDGGVLAGDPQFLWDKTTNLLTVTGAATITGDLTVDTSTLVVESSTNRVRIAKSTAANYPLDVAGRISYSGAIGEGADTTLSSSGTSLLFGNSATWVQQVFYIAGAEAMRLNSSGLGVGGAPVNPLTVFAAASAKAPALLLSTAGSPTYGWDFSVDGAVNGNLFIRSLIGGTKTDVLEFDRATGNVGIGVSPGYKLDVNGVARVSSGGDGVFLSSASSPDLYVVGVNYYNNNGTEGVQVSARPSWRIEHKNSSDALAYLDIGFRAASAAASAFTSRFKIDGSGNVISNVTGTAPTLATNSQMVFNLTSNTNLRISVRGSDGVTRTTNLTLA